MIGLALGCLLLFQATSSDADARRAAVEARLLPSPWARGFAFPLQERMRQLGVPGASVAVVSDGKIDWARGYGVREAGQVEPVTTETLFQAASISKPVSALAALRMVGMGELDLDTPVRSYLRSWELPETRHEKDHALTLRHVFSHTGGLTVHGFAGYASFQLLPSVPELLSGEFPANSANVTLDRRPGMGVRYSGGGTTVAQLAMVDVAGKSFTKLTSELVLQPLGMTRSTYAQPLDVARWPNHTAGHGLGARVQLGRFRVHPEQAAAGLWTTPSDLARFATELQAAWRGESEFLSQELAREMLTPVAGSSGLGVFLEDREGETWFGHGGSNIGFKCQFYASREGGRGVFVMTNGDYGSLLAEEVIRAVADVYGWPGWVEPALPYEPLDEETLAACAGRFLGPSSEVFHVTAEGEELFFNAVPGVRERLVHVGELRFLVYGAGMSLVFDEIEDAGFMAIRVEQRGGGARLKRTLLEEPTASELLAAGDVDAGIALFRDLLSTDPRSAAVGADRLNSLATDLWDERHDAAALAVARLAVELHPRVANSWDTLGQFLAQTGDTVGAIDAYGRCLELLEASPSGGGRWFGTHVPAVLDWLQSQEG